MRFGKRDNITDIRVNEKTEEIYKTVLDTAVEQYIDAQKASAESNRATAVSKEEDSAA